MDLSKITSLSAGQLQKMRTPATGDSGSLLGVGTPNAGRPGMAGPSFGETLTDAIGQVDSAQKVADAQTAAFAAGEQENLHEVMIAMNQAELSLQLMTEVRNKMLDTYQELMRMQV